MTTKELLITVVDGQGGGIGESDATRILIPFDSCNTKIAMLSTGPLQQFIDRSVQMTIQRIKELS